MNRSLKLASLALVILTLSLMPLAASACGNKGAGHGCSMHSGKGPCVPMKDAAMTVVNTDDGVKITLTSDKPETVKGLQECAGKCAAKGGDAGMGLSMKGATAKTANLDNGVEITLSSDEPETVKALQERAAQCSVRHEKGAQASPGCAKMGRGKAGAHAGLKDAEVRVENLPNGATITLTSDDPEVVKAIQAHATQCSTHHDKAGK